MKDRGVSPQTCHRQPGGTHRLGSSPTPSAAHLLGDPDGKGAALEAQRAQHVALCRVGALPRHGNSPAASSCPGISLISIPSPFLLLPLRAVINPVGL